VHLSAPNKSSLAGKKHFPAFSFLFSRHSELGLFNEEAFDLRNLVIAKASSFTLPTAFSPILQRIYNLVLVTIFQNWVLLFPCCVGVDFSEISVCGNQIDV
jgi:hypothetical protein